MGKVTFKFSKPGGCFCHAAAKKAAAQAGGRLPTLKEMQKFVKKNGGYALYPGCDIWVAVEDKNGKDWAQAGDKHHKPGKSHVKGCGSYPTWGDDANISYPFAAVLCVATPKIRYLNDGTHYTWKSAQAKAQSLGGRLATVKEAKKYAGDNGAWASGSDAWAPATDKKGGKDWIQIGDKHHKPAKSHTHEQGGYPSWGDDDSAKDNYGFNTHLVYYKSDYQWEKSSNHHTWEDAAKACLAKGGRLLTLKEAKEFLTNNPLLSGGDAWAPVLNKKGRDWVQIGDKHHKPGKSHVNEQGGYPSWGDDDSAKNNYGFNVYLLWQ